MMKRILLVPAVLLISVQLFGQGFGVPSKRGGIGFGNLTNFTGVRFNFKDRNIERITGINVTVWNAKHTEDQTGTMTGISLGLPMAMGVENQRGASVGIFGAGASKTLSGINVAGLGLGAGDRVSGINLAGLGIGSGGSLSGINIAGLGAGAGGNVNGFNFGGLGIGAGGNLNGFSFGGLGVGAGGKVTGISVGGIGIGAGDDLTGISAALVGIGSGKRMRGIQVAGIGIGAGEMVSGLTIAGIGIGSETVKGVAVAGAVGGMKVLGIMIAPAWLRVGDDSREKNNDGDDASIDPVQEGEMKGISVSAFNQIKGTQKGVAFGIVNYTRKIRGVQFGVINIVRENPRGLRVLPIFNTRFGKRG